MSLELKVPSVGESITEVMIGEWLKAEGDHVERDETVCMIETDKVTVELPAPASGVIKEIKVKQGETAQIGDVIGMLEEGEAPQKPAESKEKPTADEPRKDDGAPVQKDPPPPAPEGSARVMPAARRAAHDAGVAPEQIQGSGPGGRVLKEDVTRAAETKAAPEPARAPRAKAPQSSDGRPEEIVPMSPMRKRIAERLVQSQQTAALLTTFNEIDMSEVMALRKEHQPKFQEKYGIKLGFMSFFVKAAIEALKLIPQVNAEIRDTDLVFKNFYDIGVAVGGGRGLVVPVIRNADRLGFAEVELAIADYAKRAQANKLSLEELQGGTFTISNGGIYGSMMSTPIINPPQSGILGLHAIQDRPVARDGQIVIRPMMYVALTYDHRIVDGREAVTFLKRVKECIEEPARILLEI